MTIELSSAALAEPPIKLTKNKNTIKKVGFLKQTSSTPDTFSSSNKGEVSFGGAKNLKSVLSKVLKNGKNLGENILIFMTAVPILLCLYPLVKSIEYLEKEANAGREEKSKKISEQEKNIPEK